MRLPEELDRLAKGNQRLHAQTMTAIARAGEFIKPGEMYFFPEYTDHGPDHVEAVWRTAWRLIADHTPVSAEDANILALGVLLHDCAMHLGLEGFRSLVEPGTRWVAVKGFPDDRPWHQLWQDFLREARRFDSRKLADLFGEQQTTLPVPDLSKPNLTEPERMLVGEFLRRHHPRLAHEIAFHGMPAKDGAGRALLDDMEPDFVHLAGLVARSHGMDLRSASDILRARKRHDDYRNVHAVFLMALLRIADYVQIQSERAPKSDLQYRTIQSNVSQLEWKAHHAVKYIRRDGDDDEAVWVDVEPGDLPAYLRVRSWLDGIQGELDHCWAVLGETYGRLTELKSLGLVFRRVRSTLDLPDFVSDWTFHPIHARFRTSGPDVLKLLVGPLYGDKPEIGIRELMANAVDAVREADLAMAGRPDDPRREQDADVVVRIEMDGDTPVAVTVSDRGIGMTADIVTNYFLTAGASFRRSADWRDRFEDDAGHAKVLRVGRFGIGALAAYLIGDEIEVTTRSIDAPEDEGITFTAHLDDDAIELKKTRCPAGTMVRVKVGERTRENVDRLARWPGEWDWYCGCQPLVLRYVGEKIVQQGVGVSPRMGWWPLRNTPFNAAFWSWDHSGIFCNSMKISRSWEEGIHALNIPDPALSIDDPDGLTPLTLQRDSLDGPLAIDRDELHRDMTLHLIMKGLVEGPFDFGTHVFDAKFNPWMVLADGFAIADPALAVEFGVRRLLVARRKWFDAPQDIERDFAVAVTDCAYEGKDWLDDLGYLAKFDDWELLISHEEDDLPVGATEYASLGSVRHFCSPNLKSPFGRMDLITEFFAAPYRDALAVLHLNAEQASSLAVEVWRDVIGNRPIPWKMGGRKEIFVQVAKRFPDIVSFYRFPSVFDDGEGEPSFDDVLGRIRSLLEEE